MIVEVVIAAANGGGAADDGELHVVDVDGFAQHGTAGKQQRCTFGAEYDDAAAFGKVGSVKESAFSEGNKTNSGVVRLYAYDLAGGVGIGADLIEIVALQKAGDGTQLGKGAKGCFVCRSELVRAHAGVLVGEGGDGAVPHRDYVVAEGGKLLVLA